MEVKKNGFTFFKYGIPISIDNYKNSKGLLSSHNWCFERLFTKFTTDNTAKFIAIDRLSNRYIFQHPDKMAELAELNNIILTLKEFLSADKFRG